MVSVAIVGAGPYGLSIAAHLKARGIEFRIFGSPMQTWLTHMPQGMRLKSEGFASSLYDPNSSFTLAHYCQQRGVRYADIGLPVRVETFADYGLKFQEQFVAELEDDSAISLERCAGGFRIGLSSGETAEARRVILAIGLSYFDYLPPVLRTLPDEFVTHSSAHHTFDRFKGLDVTVIGAGASAADVAVALLNAGATVGIVARKPVFHFHNPPGRIPRPLVERIRFPMTGLGPGWRSLFCTSAPLIFRQMPERFRLEMARRHLGPAAGWVAKERIVGHVPLHLGLKIAEATRNNSRLELRLLSSDGSVSTLETGHVIAATGYRVDLRRVDFLNPELLPNIRSVENTPVLTSNFESSIPGLYFVGAASANTFGPLARFAYGARFTARRLSRYLARVNGTAES